MDFSDKEKRRAYLRERGIFPLRIPIPLIVDHVNCYYIDGPVPILIDTGFFGDPPFAALTEQLAALGKTIGEIGIVLLTHGHRDHSGLARRVRGRSGARILLHERDTQMLVPDSFSDYLGRVFVYYGEMGVAPERIREMESLSFGERGRYGQEVRNDDREIIDGFIRAGDRFESGAGPITVVETPGHTRGSVSLLLEEDRILFSGDLVSMAYDPLPLVMVEREDGGWLNTYDDYRASLELVAGLDPALLFPGHGGPVSHGRRFIERIMSAQERVAGKIEQALRSDEVQTIASLTETIYPGAAGPLLTNALNLVRGIAIRFAREDKVQLDGGRVVRLNT